MSALALPRLCPCLRSCSYPSSDAVRGGVRVGVAWWVEVRCFFFCWRWVFCVASFGREQQTLLDSRRSTLLRLVCGRPVLKTNSSGTRLWYPFLFFFFFVVLRCFYPSRAPRYTKLAFCVLPVGARRQVKIASKQNMLRASNRKR